MKNYKIKIITILLIVAGVVNACSKDKSNIEKDNNKNNKKIEIATRDFDGVYNGYTFLDKDTVASWKIAIRHGVITGVSSSEQNQMKLDGSVSNVGKVTAMSFNQNGYVINFSGAIYDITISGLWKEKDGERFGTAEGKRESSGVLSKYDGMYKGVALSQKDKIADWKFSIKKGVITSISTLENDNIAATGIVDGQGNIMLTTVNKEGHTLSVTGVITNKRFSGKWIDRDDNDHGVVTGKKYSK